MNGCAGKSKSAIFENERERAENERLSAAVIPGRRCYVADLVEAAVRLPVRARRR
jgi:hypothetical protein